MEYCSGVAAECASAVNPIEAQYPTLASADSAVAIPDSALLAAVSSNCKFPDIFNWVSEVTMALMPIIMIRINTMMLVTSVEPAPRRSVWNLTV